MSEYKYTLKDKAGNVWLDTRGSGLRMHGTSSALDKLYEDAYSTMNIYGQGFYTTDARDIAEGYTKKGKGTTPNIYDAKERSPVKLFDLDAPLSKEQKAYFADLFGELADEDEVTLRDFYDNARGNSRYAGYSADDVQELFYAAQDKLAEEGYGGFQHVGGDKTNNKPHKVRIYWDAANQLDLEEMAKDMFQVNAPKATGLFDELSKEGRAVMPAPQRMFDPESQAYKPFLSEFDYTPGGRYVSMGATKQDITGQFPKSAVIKIEPDGKAKMLVSQETRESDQPGKRVKGKSQVKTNLFKQEGGWKWEQAPEGIDPTPNPKFPVVSVEKGGKHYYALQTEYPEGVEMSRYPDKDSEPRLRPTKYKGEVELGKQVGSIRTNSGKIHPVYDKLKIFGPAGAAVGLGLTALGMSDDVLAGGIDLDDYTPGDILDMLAPLGFEIPQAGAGSDVVPVDEQGEPVYPFLDEMDMRNQMLENPLLD